MHKCRLCFDSLQANVWNEPLFESEHFIVLPSLGALVEGWLLLVPKDHFICIGALPESVIAEMEGIKAVVTSFLTECYGDLSVFEHGPHVEKLQIGCGVDHAHLHFVPLTFDLANAVAPFLPRDITWSSARYQECRNAFLRGEDYLYFEQPLGNGRIAINTAFDGQIFRRGIAATLGRLDEYNWREHPQFSNITATIAKAKRYIRSRAARQYLAEAAA
jgi:ATP adenylyltransferase